MSQEESGRIQELRSRIVRLERDLLHSRKLQAMGLLASGLAHDLNNVLAAMSGYAELLRKRFAEKEPDVGRYADIMLESCGRASAMVDRLRSLSRRDRSRESLIDANSIMVELREIIPFIMPNRYSFSWDLAASSPWLTGDPNLFQGAVLHLLILAREALPKGGTMTVRTSNFSMRIGSTAPQPVLALDLVSSDERLEWPLIERVMRAGSDSDPLTIAQSAGLHVVREYAASQGGAFLFDRVTSTTVRMRLVFPLTMLKAPEASVEEENLALLHSPEIPELKAPAAPVSVQDATRVVTPAPAFTPQPETKERLPIVLVLDDEFEVCGMLGRMARGLGLEPKCFYSAEEARNVLQQGLVVNAALVDNHLLGEDGLDFLGWLRNEDSNVKLALTTGYAGDVDARLLQACGITLFEKPFDFTRVTAWLQSVKAT